MPIKSKVKWGKVNVPNAMLEIVDKFVKTERAKQLGIHSRSDFVTEATRELLKREKML